MKYDWAGIDYGAKLAGTTVICYAENDELQFLQVEKKVDADKWLIEKIQNHSFSKILLDAPLSLPTAYYGQGDNYFYRSCDIITSAMSPMFLGGLTARAMKLNAQLSGTTVIETYPGYLVRKVLSLSELYQKRKKFSDDILKHLLAIIPLGLGKNPENWHQLDALLCWISGYRFTTDQALIIGEKEEGQITI